MKKITLLLIALLITTLQTQATHIIGGQITSRCLGGLTQEVTLTLLRDIQGLPIAAQTISYSANTQTYNVFRTVSPGALTLVNITTEMYQFIDTITLPYIDSYTISNTNCCRPAFIVNIPNPASTPLYLETIVNVDTTCNSTPIMPINTYNDAYVGALFSYNISVSDPDGDNLYYSFITPLSNTLTPVLGYTVPSGIVITSNGIINWIPTSPGSYSICIQIDESRNGTIIGNIKREMQFNVGIFNSINEISNQSNSNSNSNYKYYDILGREVRQDYGVLKVEQK